MLDFGYYNMDCKEGMKEFPDKYFDLAIIDPPYGINVDVAGRKKSRGKLTAARDYEPFAGGDKEPPDEAYFRELFRVSKNQIIFGANHFISKIPYDSSCWIVWDKDNGGTDFADCELAWTSFRRSIKKIRYTWSGMRQGNMKHKEYRIHPTQKPVPLYRWILATFANPGDKLLDTHVGSASSLIAFDEAGYQFVGFEKSKYYYDLSLRRYQQEAAQMKLTDFL